MAYLPYAIEPTVLKPQFFPFEYFYNTTSLLSVSTLRDWKRIKDPSPGDFEGLERYLSVPLDEETRLVFQKHLDKALEGREGIGEKIEGILNSFTTYQYELGFNDDVSVLKLRRFLDVTRSGDCSEFSNTTAILGRLAGIPTRVVTGYLASKDLQTPAHRQGVRKLRSMIEELAGYPEEQIYLVTTAHRHSWAQYYIPGLGWVDIESTGYAIPPPPGFDPNSRDVVIPLIRDNTRELNSFTFPWRFILKVVLMVIGGVVVFLYLLRYGREVYLTMITKSYTPRAVRALYTLLLMKTASAGWPLKEPSKTPKEYAEEHPALTGFAVVYTQLRYRDRAAGEEKERLYHRLKEEYRTILEQGKDRSFIVRVFSLKGLYY